MKEAIARLNTTKGNTMYLTIPSELVTDSFFPFEKSGETVKLRIQGGTISVAKARRVDVLSRLDSFSKVCINRFGDAKVWEYGENLDSTELLPFAAVESLEEEAGDQKRAVFESFGWMISAANYGFVTGTVQSDMNAYLYEAARLALSKYNPGESSFRVAVNDSLLYMRSLVQKDLSGFHTAHAVPKTTLKFHHKWIREVAEATGFEFEEFLPEVAYDIAPFVLLTGLAISLGSDVRGWLTRTEVDPFGGNAIRFNVNVSQALLYSIRILKERKKLSFSSESTPRIMDFTDIIAEAMLDLDLPPSPENQD